MALSSAYSLMEATRIPLRLSLGLKATVCSCSRVNLEDFQTKMTLNRVLSWLPSSIISLN